MKDMEKQIDCWIEAHKEEMIEELKLWVSQPSVSRADLAAPNAPFGPDCRKMLDLALERGGHYGFETRDYDGYCGSISYGDSAKEIGMIAHLDVVPEGDHWIYQPYQPVIEQGFMIGRGCSDNKGPGVLCLFLMRFFKENDIPLKHSLRLLVGCAEETGMADFAHFVNVMKEPVPGVSLVADAGFPVCYAQKGGFDATYRIPCGKNLLSMDAGLVRNAVPDTAIARISGISYEEAEPVLAAFDKISLEAVADKEIKVIGHGKAGHAAFPAFGERNNAIVNLCEGLAELEKAKGLDLLGAAFLAEKFSTQFGDGMGIAFSDEESGVLTMNAGVIHKVGEELLLEIDIRYPVTDTAERLEKALAAAVDEIGGQLIIRQISKPYYISKEDPKVRALMDAYHEVTGDDAQPYSMGGGTYSRVIPNAITFGPGLRTEKKADFLPAGHGGAHGPDEVLNLEEWLTGFKIYALSLLKLDQVSE